MDDLLLCHLPLRPLPGDIGMILFAGDQRLFFATAPAPNRHGTEDRTLAIIALRVTELNENWHQTGNHLTLAT